MSDDVFNATLIERHDLTEDLSIVKVRPDDGDIAEFKAGQFVTLGLPRAPDDVPATRPGKEPPVRPKLVRRAYSIASSPKVRDHLELYVVLVQGGKLTTRLWTIDVGDKLFMDPRIRGEFTLDPVPDGKDLVFIATGTGIAPFISMIRTWRGTGRWKRCTMIHGVRRSTHLGYRDELSNYAAGDPDFTYIPVVSDEPKDSAWQGTRGRAQVALDPDTYQDLTGAPLNPQHAHVYLCGNPAMIVDVQKILEDRGFITHTKKEPGNIHFERYW